MVPYTLTLALLYATVTIILAYTLTITLLYKVNYICSLYIYNVAIRYDITLPMTTFDSFIIALGV